VAVIHGKTGIRDQYHLPEILNPTSCFLRAKLLKQTTTTRLPKSSEKQLVFSLKIKADNTTASRGESNMVLLLVEGPKCRMAA